MRIRADKTQPDSPHALSTSVVRRILESVPPEWVEDIRSVRLTNSHAHHCYAFLSRHEGSLTVFCQKSSCKEAILAVLSELAAHSMGINRNFGVAQSKAESRRILSLVQPYLEQILASIPPQEQQRHFGVPPPPPFRAVI